jgi:hypothetical protein
MLELHEFDVTRDNVEAGKICALDNLGQRAPMVVVSNGSVQSLVWSDVEFRLISVQSGQAGLRIEIDSENSVPPQSEVLRKMRGSRGFSRATLEVNDGDNLQMLALTAMRKIPTLSLTALI